jgi:dTDP-4-dehydrorhamnose reductase
MEEISNSNELIVLVTGANGQLGSEIKAIAHNYLQLNFIFTDIDDLDITNEKALNGFFQKIQPDFIINCAAYTAVDGAEDNEKSAFLLNADAPKLLAESAKRFDAKLIHVSTDYVFNGKTWEPYAEDHPTSPDSVYGKSKLQGENWALDSGVAMVVRTSWLYSNFGNNFVKTIARKGQTVEELRVIYDQIGSPTWGHDLAKALIDIVLKNTSKFSAEVFHYSNEGVCSWYDFALEIVSFLNINCQVIPVLSSEYQTKAKRPPYSVLNKAKIKNTFGIKIPHWKDSLHKSLENMDIA